MTKISVVEIEADLETAITTFKSQIDGLIARAEEGRKTAGRALLKSSSAKEVRELGDLSHDLALLGERLVSIAMVHFFNQKVKKALPHPSKEAKKADLAHSAAERGGDYVDPNHSAIGEYDEEKTEFDGAGGVEG